MAEVQFEVRGNVAYITLNRPEAANALNAELARQLDQAAWLPNREPHRPAAVTAGDRSPPSVRSHAANPCWTTTAPAVPGLRLGDVR